MADTITQTFAIEDMHCTACAVNIDLELEDLEGIYSAKTNYAKQLCVVEYDSARVTPEMIVQTIKASGYTAEPA